MLTQIENNNGIISYDDTLLDQIINESLLKYKGAYKNLKKDSFINENGLSIVISLNLKIGTSISQISKDVLLNLAKVIEDNLELPIDHLIFQINGIYSKKLVKKDIVFEYTNKSGITSNNY